MINETKFKKYLFWHYCIPETMAGEKNQKKAISWNTDRYTNHRLLCKVVSAVIGTEGSGTMQVSLEVVNLKLEDENSSWGTKDLRAF